MISDYEFRSHWLICRNRETLWDALELLLASDDPMSWWPSVQVTEYDGHTLDLRAVSRLGYALSFRLSDLQVARPTGLSFVSVGELLGAGTVTCEDLSPSESTMSIHWRVATDKAWMRRTAWLLRPIFVLGHHLAMWQGQKHFNRWLRTR